MLFTPLSKLLPLLPDDAKLGKISADARYIVISHFPESGVIVSSSEFTLQHFDYEAEDVHVEKPTIIGIVDTLADDWHAETHYGACEVCGKPRASLPLDPCRRCKRWCCSECQRLDNDAFNDYGTSCGNPECKDAAKVAPVVIDPDTPVTLVFEVITATAGRVGLFAGDRLLGKWRTWHPLEGKATPQQIENENWEVRQWTDRQPDVEYREASDAVRERHAERAKIANRCPICGLPLRYSCDCHLGPEHG